MRINTNSLSLTAQRNLANTTRALARSMEKLASGSRINSARDDASGLAISNRLSSEIRGLKQIARGLNDSYALLTAADGIMASQVELIQRMRELALQSANGTLSDDSRSYLQLEFSQLLTEFDRLSRESKFGDRYLLDGSFEKSSIQVGTNKGQDIDIELSSTSLDNIFTQTVGTGRFQLSRTMATGSNPWFAETADFNNDGNLDIVTANTTSNTSSIRLGMGNGLFSSEIRLTASSVASIAVGDFNEDGNADIALGSSSGSGDITIFIGNGNGSFKSATTYASGSSTGSLRGLVTGDMNNDGHLDLISTNYTLGYANITYGNGEGQFLTSQTLSVGTTPADIRVHDINNDGWLDIVTSKYTAQAINILLGSSNGTYTPQQTITPGADVYSTDFGDLNGDGIDDMIAGFEGSSSVRIYIGNGNGTYQTPLLVDMSVGSARYPKLTDINKDGILDIATGGTNGFSTRLGNGDGTFQSAMTMAVGSTPWSLSADDFNGDGVVDVILGDWGTSSISFLTSETTTASARSRLSIATQDSASNSLELLDNGLANLIASRAEVGAQQSRLEFALSHTLNTKENLSSAQSQIADADIASEMAEYTRNQILVQAGLSVLTQANLQQNLALQLLKNL